MSTHAQAITLLSDYCLNRGEGLVGDHDYDRYDHQYCDGSFFLSQRLSYSVTYSLLFLSLFSLLPTIFVSYRIARAQKSGFSLTSVHLLIASQLLFAWHCYMQLSGIESLTIPIPRRGVYNDIPSIFLWALSMTLAAGYVDILLYEEQVKRRGEEHDLIIVLWRVVSMGKRIVAALSIFWYWGLMIWPIMQVVSGIKITIAARRTFQSLNSSTDGEAEKGQAGEKSDTNTTAVETISFSPASWSSLPTVIKFVAAIFILQGLLTLVFLFSNFPSVWDGWAPLETTYTMVFWEVLCEGLGGLVLVKLAYAEYTAITTVAL